MSCNCGCNFCWSCGVELPKDSRGFYSTEMHFRPDRFGIGREGGCVQFD
jgi:hypothetical protein